MDTITTKILIGNDRRLNLDIDLPSDCPTGMATVSLTVKAKDREDLSHNRLAEIYGHGKGKIWMSDDFDAPLEDFAEYT